MTLGFPFGGFHFSPVKTGFFPGGGFGAFSYWTLGFDLGIPDIFDLGI